MEPLFFALRRYGAFVLCPAKLSSNATFALQTHKDIASGAKITTIIKPHNIFSYLKKLLYIFKENKKKNCGMVQGRLCIFGKLAETITKKHFITCYLGLLSFSLNFDHTKSSK